MDIGINPQPKFKKIEMLLLGLVLSSALFGYGVYSLIQASCMLLGRGNSPIGIFVTFYGVEARLLSTIYLGAGAWLFATKFLRKRHAYQQAKFLSWCGAIILLFGMCSLVVILCSSLFY